MLRRVLRLTLDGHLVRTHYRHRLRLRLFLSRKGILGVGQVRLVVVIGERLRPASSTSRCGRHGGTGQRYAGGDRPWRTTRPPERAPLLWLPLLWLPLLRLALLGLSPVWPCVLGRCPSWRCLIGRCLVGGRPFCLRLHVRLRPLGLVEPTS